MALNGEKIQIAPQIHDATDNGAGVWATGDSKNASAGCPPDNTLACSSPEMYDD